MSVVQYNRKASLLIGMNEGEALDLSEFRFMFSVRRGDRQTPNTVDIRVYNLKDETNQRVQKEFERVVLQAGYEGNYGIIFDGEIKQVRRGRETPTDTYIDITAAEGDSAYNFSVTAISLAAESTGAQSTVEAVIANMARFNVTKGYVPDNMPNDPLPRGRVIYGMTRDELRSVALNTGTSWSIQDGKVNFIPETAYLPGEIPVLSYETGVIGLPEQTQNGIRIKVLLNPNLKIGQAIELDNRSIQQYRYNPSPIAQAQNMREASQNKLNDKGEQSSGQDFGRYYVMQAEHTGDTRGNDWYTDLVCLSVDATVPNEYAGKVALGQEAIGAIKRYG